MRRWLLSVGVVSVLALGVSVQLRAQALVRLPSTEGARVYIIEPSGGEPVVSPVKVQFGLSGMGIAPAGVEVASTGHHHLLIDTGLPSLDGAIPNDAKHRHFGGGQTETILELSPGRHTLQLLFADHRHVPHAPPLVSDLITVTVP